MSVGGKPTFVDAHNTIEWFKSNGFVRALVTNSWVEPRFVLSCHVRGVISNSISRSSMIWSGLVRHPGHVSSNCGLADSLLYAVSSMNQRLDYHSGHGRRAAFEWPSALFACCRKQLTAWRALVNMWKLAPWRTSFSTLFGSSSRAFQFQPWRVRFTLSWLISESVIVVSQTDMNNVNSGLLLLGASVVPIRCGTSVPFISWPISCTVKASNFGPFFFQKGWLLSKRVLQENE
jgi:hypothetical protein